MIVMWHRFDYELNGKTKELNSWMVVNGEDETYTAMSNTVGLPLAIAAKDILDGRSHWKRSDDAIEQRDLCTRAR